MNKISIDKIQITIGDQNVEMTLDQAKALKLALEELFPAPVITEILPLYPQPIYVEKRWPVTPWWEQPTIICQTEGTTLCLVAK